jgi:SAM-dependent methyltransferase
VPRYAREEAATAADLTPPRAWPTLDLLACPACNGALKAAGGDAELACAGCGREWGERGGWLDFRRAEPAELGVHWSERQRSMEGWYDNLITASDQAEECYRHDYEALAPRLARLRGLTLDIGGGNGIVRQYLTYPAHYVDLDPSEAWLREEWLAVAAHFPALRAPITFVLGVGERLPFRSNRFDTVLSIFSINHAAKPARVVDEAERVLRPGGILLLVAEDIEPGWLDLLRPGYRAGWTPLRRALPDKLATLAGRRPWPVHPEHLRITEPELREWLTPGFEITDRAWVAGWLTIEARKRAPVVTGGG